MSEESFPTTRAVEVLRLAGIQFSNHLYAYDDSGGTALCAKQLSIDEHAIVKAIVLEADGKPLIVLMHGDMRASVKDLTAIAGAKAITPCLSGRVEQITGYQFGGVSPFGAATEMPVYMEETILNLRKVYVNGGKRGYLIGMDPYDIEKVLHPTVVKIGAARAA